MEEDKRVGERGNMGYIQLYTKRKIIRNGAKVIILTGLKNEVIRVMGWDIIS